MSSEKKHRKDLRSTNREEQLLGSILHTVGEEAVFQSTTKYPRPGSKVFLESGEFIGTLGNPFGSVDSPYQVVVLHAEVQKHELPGKNIKTITLDLPKSKKKKQHKRK